MVAEVSLLKLKIKETEETIHLCSLLWDGDTDTFMVKFFRLVFIITVLCINKALLPVQLSYEFFSFV